MANAIKQRGQITVELVLISVIFIAVAMAVSNSFRRNDSLGNLVEGPWAYIDGMARHGSWGTARQTRLVDPNFMPRRASMDGEARR